jgi:alpha-mannosidase
VPLLSGLSNYKAGALPPQAHGLTLSRGGVRVTAFGPNPDGEGTLLRLWELTGAGGDCAVVLPEAMTVSAARPVDLRGRPIGEPVPVKDHAFRTSLRAFAPASYLLE